MKKKKQTKKVRKITYAPEVWIKLERLDGQDFRLKCISEKTITA